MSPLSAKELAFLVERKVGSDFDQQLFESLVTASHGDEKQLVESVSSNYVVNEETARAMVRYLRFDYRFSRLFVPKKSDDSKV